MISRVDGHYYYDLIDVGFLGRRRGQWVQDRHVKMFKACFFFLFLFDADAPPKGRLTPRCYTYKNIFLFSSTDHGRSTNDSVNTASSLYRNDRTFHLQEAVQPLALVRRRSQLRSCSYIYMFVLLFSFPSFSFPYF